MAAVESIKPYGDSDARGKATQVASMFDAIAPAYDLMNRAMSFGLDRCWLRSLLSAVKASDPKTVADLATGTGDVALALCRALPASTVMGLDISEGMLDKARAKAAEAGTENVTFAKADALDSGLPDASVDAVTVAYGVRNFADIAGGYAEMYRIIRPGGKVFVLELSVPRQGILKALYRLYTKTLIPLGGRLLSGDSRAYSYLPESIAAAPQRGDMTALMKSAGFADATYRSLFPGVCTLYLASK